MRAAYVLPRTTRRSNIMLVGIADGSSSRYCSMQWSVTWGNVWRCRSKGALATHLPAAAKGLHTPPREATMCCNLGDAYTLKVAVLTFSSAACSRPVCAHAQLRLLMLS
eukprot:GHRQ01022750.1.p2 GENE.GHRQ01022750.1~~GHRQ01022750.1.p2  ORF type:complete len:109 (-),score=8.12 GHRQ01022750.1:105-431(-)